jgi:hypothetical protein
MATDQQRPGRTRKGWRSKKKQSSSQEEKADLDDGWVAFVPKAPAKASSHPSATWLPSVEVSVVVWHCVRKAKRASPEVLPLRITLVSDKSISSEYCQA